jgi:hypothetical protein
MESENDNLAPFIASCSLRPDLIVLVSKAKSCAVYESLLSPYSAATMFPGATCRTQSLDFIGVAVKPTPSPSFSDGAANQRCRICL